MTENKYKKRYHSVPISHMLKYGKITAPTTLDKLNKELLEMYEKVSLSKDEIEMRNQVFNKFKKYIEEEIDCKVESFGSYRTGMMVYDSDIDITVVLNNSNIKDDDKIEINNILNQISDIIYKSKISTGNLIHVKKAKTPILKCVDSLFKYKIDISINKKDGISTADFIKEQLAIRPEMKYFIIILKYYLKCRRLSDTSCGGLCAYAQFLMILSFFQLHPLLQNDNLNVKENLAVLLMDFFQFYGVDFPFDKTGISVGETKYVQNRGSYVYIEDPVTVGNNVAGGCTSIGLIKDLFNYSYKIMAAAISMQVDPSKNIVELWLRINKDKMNERKKLMVKRK